MYASTLCPWWCAHRCWIKSCCTVYWVPLRAPILWKINRQYPVVCTWAEEGCFKFAWVTSVSSFLSIFKFLSFWVFDVMLSTFLWQSFLNCYFWEKNPTKIKQTTSHYPSSRRALEKVTGRSWFFASLMRTTWTFNCTWKKPQVEQVWEEEEVWPAVVSVMCWPRAWETRRGTKGLLW